VQAGDDNQEPERDAPGSLDGTGPGRLAREPVNGNVASHWLPQQQSDSSYQFKNLSSGLGLDVYEAGSNQGQQLDRWPCKNAPGTNQDFTAK
jgi:hypothetical protein